MPTGPMPVARRTVLVNWDAIEAEEHRVLAERLAGRGQKYPDVPWSGSFGGIARPTRRNPAGPAAR